MAIPATSRTRPGRGERKRSNACSSSPALSAAAGRARATSRAATKLPAAAIAIPRSANTSAAHGSSTSDDDTQHDVGERIAGSKSHDRSGDAEHGAFADEQRDETLAREPERAQQRELR